MEPQARGATVDGASLSTDLSPYTEEKMGLPRRCHLPWQRIPLQAGMQTVGPLERDPAVLAEGLAWAVHGQRRHTTEAWIDLPGGRHHDQHDGQVKSYYTGCAVTAGIGVKAEC